MSDERPASARVDLPLPSGTVTFLFTDIEGSTRLANLLGERFPASLAAHHRIIREAISASGGTVVSTEGDSFFAVFPLATHAFAAAIAAQRGLAAHDWEGGLAVRVRMGLHTGEAAIGGDNYIGLEVVRAARTMAAGHGGQVLLSDATAALVGSHLPDGVRMRTLGTFGLKDLATPQRLHQLDIDGLDVTFPPLRALDQRPAHLPAETTTFIGRDVEVRALLALLAGRRLITLTGPGGTGKTRWALRAAAEAAGRFADGAYFVAAATISDAHLLPTAVGSNLGLREDPGRPMSDVVIDWFRDRECLLVLDNLEQVEGSAQFVDPLLASASRLRVLATSRAPLRVSGEQEFPVPPFSVPNPEADLQTLETSDAVRLFIDRARLVRPDFAPGADELAVVADICQRLDGLPLAIELVAARLRLFPPAAIRDRLGRRLDALVGGAADLPRRQQSMRAAIAWSYDLLHEPERALFRRLAVFVGGWTLEAAEQVGGHAPVSDVAATLESLVAQSLVQPVDTGDELRFTMLATIGEFAADELNGTDEAADVRRRHAAFFRRLAEQAYVESQGPAADPWFDRLDADLDNLRVAIARAASDRDLPTALAIAGTLGPFSLQRNHSAEGRRILAGLIERPDVPAGREFAGAAAAAAYMDTWLGDYLMAARMGELAVAVYRQLGDRTGLSDALGSLGFATIERDPNAALAMFDESLALARERADLGREGRLSLARAIALFRLGRLADARTSLERAVEFGRQTGDRYFEMMSRYPLARTKLLMGDTPAAMRDYRATLEEFQALDLRIGVAVGLDNYAEVAVWSGDVRRGVRLAAAAARMKEELGGGPPANMIGAVDTLVVGRDKLGVEEFEQEVAAGRAMDVDTAVAEALAAQAPAGPPPMAQPEPA